MGRHGRCFHMIIATCAVILAAFLFKISNRPPSSIPTSNQRESPRRLEIAHDNSDKYAAAAVVVEAPKELYLGISADDHERITSTLAATKELTNKARKLVQDKRTLKEGQEMIEKANAMFREAKDHVVRAQINMDQNRKELVVREDETNRKMLKEPYNDVEEADEDEKRAMDVSRNMYETVITFPECVERFFEDCIAYINADLEELGLSTLEVVVREKRNTNQEGYNKVVIVTNGLADRVVGRAGDGIVHYPFMWDDSETGLRMLGVDGKWNCQNDSPEECCSTIKHSVPNSDVHGKSIECHIFVPFGGVGNPRRNDRVIVNLSPDGRVHEPPRVQ
mmetsp:Transcript_24342/g.52170  ORF Transcript_24342/g.52170 Transcript_24342/m.52170 type:complete len:336 (-) Transcript_24342:297-1304(-)